MLFERGHSFVVHPVRVVWQHVEAPPTLFLQFGVAVSPRKFPKAVQRNRIKRLLRESYRHQKNILLSSLEEKQKGLLVMLLYIGNHEPTYGDLEKKIITSFQRLAQNDNHSEQAH